MCMEHKTVICYTKALRWPNVNVAIVHNATVSLSLMHSATKYTIPLTRRDYIFCFKKLLYKQTSLNKTMR